MSLASIKRPSLALIKLVESTGILLGIQKKYGEKSRYKAPTPTNYDETVQKLSDDFYGCMSLISSMDISTIPNDVASELYEKTVEPGFDYEGRL